MLKKHKKNEDTPLFDLTTLYNDLPKITSNDLDKSNLIISKLKELVNILKQLDNKNKDSFKILSLNKGIKVLESNKPITSGKDMMKLPSIGKGIAERIDEIIDTGNLKELDELSKKIDTIIIDKNKVISELMTVTGIGFTKANQLFDLNVISVSDLIDKWEKGILKVQKNVLTHHIIIGLKYYYDLKLRAPWDEIDSMRTVLEEAGKRLKVKISICGSYRRLQPTCGDIDVLITHKEIKKDEDVTKSNILIDYVNILTEINFIRDSLTSEGTTKFMGVAKLRDDLPGRRIDIRLVSKEAYPYALLYFTGSGEFNKIMRNYANSLNYTLNEYGIYKISDTDTKIILDKEKDIFALLNCKYIEPKDRQI